MQKGCYKRMRYSWLLLLVYVPMLLAVTLHRHGEAQVANAEIYCEDCAHNIHHSGHLVQLQPNAQHCVLCQLQNTPCVAPILILGMVLALPYCPIVSLVPALYLCRPKALTSPRAPPYSILLLLMVL